MSKPLNKMTNEELAAYQAELRIRTDDEEARKTEFNRRLLERTRETVLLLKRICQHLGLSQDTTNIRQG